MSNPFADIEPLKVGKDSRADLIKHHGHDPSLMRYRDHDYKLPELPALVPLSEKFLEAQAKIEAVIHQVRDQHPRLNARDAWIKAGKSIGIDIEKIPCHEE